MLPTIEYLAWARRFYGQSPFDLARSGMPDVAASSLAPSSVRADDAGAHARYVRAIAARYGVLADEVVPTLGASGGIWTAYAGLASRGDEVLVEAPAYEPLVRVAEGLGLRVRRFARDAEKRFALDPDAVLGALSNETRLVAVSNPHNPSAALTDDDTLRRLAAELERRGVLLVVDEVYRELVAPRTTARRLGRNVVVQSSLTKCFGLGWARAGWLVAPAELAARAFEPLVHATGALPPAQAAFGELGLAQADMLLARGAEGQAGKRALVEAFLRKHAATLAWSDPPEGSIFSFVVDRRGRDLRDAIERGIATEKVIVAPGSFFEWPAGFRLSFTASTRAVAEGLARLERVLGLGALA